MVAVAEATPVGGAVTRLGEGAIWIHEQGRLLWVDVPAGTILSLEGDDESHVVGRHEGTVSFIAPRSRAGLVVAVDGEVRLLDGQGRIEKVIDLESSIDTNRLNDGCCDARGRLWIGSMARDDATREAGALYRVDRDLTVHRILTDVSISNGIDWNSDASIMYYVDTPSLRIDSFDYDIRTGRPTHRRTFVDLCDAPGSPDGLTVDALDRVWVALWGAGEVRCYSTTGRLDGVVSVPTDNVTSTAFGGPRLDRMFITSAFGDPSDPMGGRLFVATGLGPGLGCRPFDA
jgi:sugar lactone lactonase YvrE